MGTLVLDRRDMALRQESDAAAVYESGQRRGTVPLKLIDLVVVHGGTITLDAGVLGRIAEQGGVGVILSGRHARRMAYVLGPSRGDIAVRLAQARAVTDDDQIDRWALLLVTQKIRRHRRLLHLARTQRPDLRKPLSDGIARLDDALNALGLIASGVRPNPGASTLRGVEGAAAAAYFRAYAQLFAPSLGFSGRNRRPPRDPVNACLSLGYTMLHAQAVRACHGAGLDPLLGLFHRPCAGRASLASDLIEPLRAWCDEWVWSRFRERDLQAEHFRQDGQACLLGKAGRGRFHASWAAQCRPVNRWLAARCRELARHWRAGGLALLPEFDAADDAAEREPS